MVPTFSSDSDGTCQLVRYLVLLGIVFGLVMLDVGPFGVAGQYP